jgi:NhaP-type Na+/H+ or K+/H+ antiporter
MHVAANILVVGFLIFVAHAFTGLFSRTRIPDVLLLTIIGIILGPVLHKVTTEKFGAIGPVFATVTLIIILFEAGLSLDLDIVRGAIRSTLTLTLTNFFLTMLTVGFAAHYLTGLRSHLAFMLGAIVASTSPAVIVPLTKKLALEESTRTTLFIESAISDVLSIVVAIGLMSSFQLGRLQVGQMLGQIIASLVLAGLAGAGAAFLWSILLRRIRGLENSIFTTPAFVFVLFGLVEWLHMSGYVAAAVFGAVLGNIEVFHGMAFMRRYLPQEAITLNETERVFMAEVVFLLKTFFFVYLGVSIKFTEPRTVYYACVFTVLIFVIRPVAAWIGLSRSTSPHDASLISIMSPKGLAAVVLASIPLEQNVPGGEALRDFTYVIVFVSIVFTCVLSFLVERSRVGKIYQIPFRRFGKGASGSAAIAAPRLMP